MTKTIAIIGFGASGIMSFYNLVDKVALNSLNIDIFDDEFKAGIAYSTSNIHHLLNVRALNISAVFEDKDHFAKWLTKNNYDFGELDFVPRKIYGLYLNDIAAKAFKMAKLKGVAVSIYRKKISEIAEKNNEFVIDKKSYQASILAVGGAMSEKNLWKINLDDYLKDPEIHLLGAGLTAFDAIVSLVDKNYQGKIFLHSRTNKLPQIHSDKNTHNLQPILNPEDGYLPLSELFRKFTKLCKNSNNWRANFDSIRPITVQLWQNLSAQKKKQFMRHCFRLYNTHRHRCPPQQYKIIADLIAKNQVILTKEKIKSPKHIECLGFNFSLTNPLIDELLRNKIIAKNELNLGVKSSFENFIIIGANNFGEMFETTAINELKGQSWQAMKKILS